MLPKVSVIIPYKTDRGFLTAAIDSVKAQTYDNLELILSQSLNGVSFNLNKGIERASGDFIRYLCDDDLLTPESIEFSVDYMMQQGCDFMHARAINFYPNGREETHTPRIKFPTLEDMLVQNQIHGGTLMYTKEVFKKFGLFNECLWTGEEYEFNLRLLSKGASLGYVNKIVYRYRRHPWQKSIGTQDEAYQRKRAEAIDDIRMMFRYRRVI